MKTTKLIIAATAITSLSACMSMNEPLNRTFGKATQQNMQAQIIDPNPSGEGPITTDGEKGAGAIERYRTGTVIKPNAPETSDVGEDNGNN